MAYAKRPTACEGCPANGHGLGFVPPTNPDGRLMTLVGQGPGEQDAWNSKAFYHLAPPGERLNKWLYHAGISRTKISVGNVIWCWLPAYRRKGVPSGTREPTRAEMKWCWNAHTGPWLQGEEIVVPVGVPATKWIMGLDPKKGAEKFLGTLNEVQLPPVGENTRA